MPTFCEITRPEMANFLEPQGFRLMCLPNVHELVYGRRADKDGRQLTVRVYTSISARDGQARAVGSDAIRVLLFEKGQDNRVRLVGGARRVNRTGGWRKSLQSRISRWHTLLGPECPKCKSLMVFKNTKRGKFWGCSRWPECQSTLSLRRST